MLKFKSLTIKNFSSIGENTQSVDFKNDGLTLILGENLETANDIAIGRNGCGKSSILNALSYALYDLPLMNDIKKNNLINNINQKGMVVVVEFLKNDIPYKIERGRKPNFLKFFVNNKEKKIGTDEAQGENKLTQVEIEKVLGLSHNLFRTIITLSTKTIPFLKESKNNQRKFIEELLGIDKLTDKATNLQADKRLVRQSLELERTKINEKEFSNKRIEETIRNLTTKSKLWDKNNTIKINSLKKSLKSLENADIDNELLLHEMLTIYIETEKDMFGFQKGIKRLNNTIGIDSNQIIKIEKYLEDTESNTCPTCKQGLHTEEHKKIEKKYNKQLNDVIINLEESLKDKEKIEIKITNCKNILEQIGDKPQTYYETLHETHEHRNNLKILTNELETLEERSNPYIDQVADLKENSLQLINYNLKEDLTKLYEHQEFLYKLLTDKESAIRKKILDQNLHFLNQRLEKYLGKLGFIQKVRFLNDLSVEILARGQELGFSQLSGGEQTRLVLALSWSFRDIFEMLNCPIDLILIDELLDNGLDAQGVESAMSIIKEMGRKNNKEIFVISHREELVSKIGNVLRVIKEEGFTRLQLEKDYFV